MPAEQMSIAEDPLKMQMLHYLFITRRCPTSTLGVASVSAVYCVWMVWTCWTRRSQYRRSSDIFVFRPSGPADTCRITLSEGQICHLCFYFEFWDESPWSFCAIPIRSRTWGAVVGLQQWPSKLARSCFWSPQISFNLRVSFQVNNVPTVYLCVCGRPAFQLWKNPTPPAISVSLQRSQLERKNAAHRGWSTPGALDLLSGL